MRLPQSLPPSLPVLLVLACSSPAEPAAVPATPEPAVAPAPAAPEPAPAAAALPSAAPGAAADPNEACGRILVVAYKGAAHAPDGVTRDKAAAQARAAELLAKVVAGAELATLARSESDAPSSAARDGIMGTFLKPDWPKLHTALRDPLFALPVGGVAQSPIEADYGYVLLQRCPVERARSRHILVRYRGAKNAEKSIKRSKAEAEARAKDLLTKVQDGGDFAALAKVESDDSSKERGGDVGLQGRGLLAPAYDRALFSMEIGKLTLVETDFGFHVIQRLPDDGALP